MNYHLFQLSKALNNPQEDSQGGWEVVGVRVGWRGGRQSLEGGEEVGEALGLEHRGDLLLGEG